MRTSQPAQTACRKGMPLPFMGVLPRKHGACDKFAAGGVWEIRSYDLSAITAVNDNANFGIRIAADLDAATGNYAAAQPGSSIGRAGTWRFDNVTISGTVVPEPGSFAALGAGLLSLAGVLKRRSR